VASGRPRPVRVLLVDDSAVLRAVLAGAIAGTDHTVVGEAADVAEAEALAASLRPDVVVVDGRLPPDGIAAIERIRAAAPEAAILIVAALKELRLVTAATVAGARGALRRPALASEVRETLAGLARTDERRRER
jgi:DNA-binding NarL/FixJ family response regulator